MSADLSKSIFSSQIIDQLSRTSLQDASSTADGQSGPHAVTISNGCPRCGQTQYASDSRSEPNGFCSSARFVPGERCPVCNRVVNEPLPQGGQHNDAGRRPQPQHVGVDVAQLVPVNAGGRFGSSGDVIDDFDVGHFGRDLNFERDFGQWFNDPIPVPSSGLHSQPQGQPYQSQWPSGGLQSVTEQAGQLPNGQGGQLLSSNPPINFINGVTSSQTGPSGILPGNGTGPGMAMDMLFDWNFSSMMGTATDDFDARDINFERDFAQWFNPDDVGVNLELK